MQASLQSPGYILAAAALAGALGSLSAEQRAMLADLLQGDAQAPGSRLRPATGGIMPGGRNGEVIEAKKGNNCIVCLPVGARVARIADGDTDY